MDAMMRLMMAAGAGVGGGGSTLYDDEFNVGTVLDVAGSRYPSAVPWTKFNPGTATYNVASDLLTIVAPTVASGIIDLRWCTMPLPAGNSRWRAQTTMVSTAANWRLAGLGLRRSSDGFIHIINLAVNGSGNFASVDRGGGSTGAFAANSASASIPGVTAVVFELERVSGGTSTVWRYSTNGGSSFTTLFTGDQFTGSAPDEIGLLCNGGLASPTTATYDYFRKVA